MGPEWSREIKMFRNAIQKSFQRFFFLLSSLHSGKVSRSARMEDSAAAVPTAAEQDAFAGLERQPAQLDSVRSTANSYVPQEIQAQENQQRRIESIQANAIRAPPSDQDTAYVPLHPMSKKNSKDESHRVERYTIDMDESMRTFFAMSDPSREELQNNPNTCAIRSKPSRYHMYLRVVFGILILQFLWTFLSVYFISKYMDMPQYADHHIWIYVVIACLMTLSFCIYCTGVSKDWPMRFQWGLLVLVTLVMILSLSVFTLFVKAVLILHSMVIVLGMLFSFFLFTFQHKIKFTIFWALVYCGLVTVIVTMVFVYYPERNHIHSLYGWANMSVEAWHVIMATLVGMACIVYILVLLYTLSHSCTCYEYLYVAFYLYFHVTFFLFLIRNATDKIKQMNSGHSQTQNSESSAFGLRLVRGV